MRTLQQPKYIMRVLTRVGFHLENPGCRYLKGERPDGMETQSKVSVEEIYSEIETIPKRSDKRGEMIAISRVVLVSLPRRVNPAPERFRPVRYG
jgi:hypothetical protein